MGVSAPTPRPSFHRIVRSALWIVLAMSALAAGSAPVSAATEPVVVQIGSTRNDEGNGVAMYGGVIYVCGTTLGSVAGQTSTGRADAFVQARDPSGTVLWTTQFGTTHAEHVFACEA